MQKSILCGMVSIGTGLITAWILNTLGLHGYYVGYTVGSVQMMVYFTALDLV